jgi:hypothetical protein
VRKLGLEVKYPLKLKEEDEEKIMPATLWKILEKRKISETLQKREFVLGFNRELIKVLDDIIIAARRERGK